MCSVDSENEGPVGLLGLQLTACNYFVKNELLMQVILMLRPFFTHVWRCVSKIWIPSDASVEVINAYLILVKICWTVQHVFSVSVKI